VQQAWVDDEMIARTVSGEPIPVGDREFVPEVKVSGFARTQRGRAAGIGVGVLQAVPVAVIERHSGGERRIPIPDATGQALRAILTTGVAVWVVLWILRRRWSHGR